MQGSDVRVGSPNRTKPNRTEPYRTLGEPNRDHVRFLANTNRDEQSLPMFGSFGCSVRQDTNRTEQMCLMFVFGSCLVRLVRYSIVPPVIDLGGPYPCLGHGTPRPGMPRHARHVPGCAYGLHFGPL